MEKPWILSLRKPPYKARHNQVLPGGSPRRSVHNDAMLAAGFGTQSVVQWAYKTTV